MSDTIKRELPLINQQVGLMAIGKRAGVSEIFGIHWKPLVKRYDPRVFGKKFKEAVQAKQIDGVIWVKIDSNGRKDSYERIS